jgi:hypothetical protein
MPRVLVAALMVGAEERAKTDFAHRHHLNKKFPGVPALLSSGGGQEDVMPPASKSC